jgi:hypothetical protein
VDAAVTDTEEVTAAITAAASTVEMDFTVAEAMADIADTAAELTADTAAELTAAMVAGAVVTEADTPEGDTVVAAGEAVTVVDTPEAGMVVDTAAITKQEECVEL